MVKHYVEFLCPGLFSSNNQCKEVQSRKPDCVNSIPKDAYAYYFFDRDVKNVNGHNFFGKITNVSPTFYLGTKYSLEEIKNQFPEENALISTMKLENHQFAVKTCKGNWEILKNGDTVI